MTIEGNFDVAFIADLSRREKQIQQNYRPVIGVHKWFARRPGTLFRGLLLSEFGTNDLSNSFYSSNNFEGITIADPFMGGGTPLIEANRVGCSILGYDINPMSYWIVRQELENIDLTLYNNTSASLIDNLEQSIGHLYRTKCEKCGTEKANVKYFLWVKIAHCRKCGNDIDLFPGYLLAKNSRHPKNVFVCYSCGALSEVEDRKNPGNCLSCGKQIMPIGPARYNRCVCPNCKTQLSYPDPSLSAPRHRMFAIEYHCRDCKPAHKGRFFKIPDSEDLEKYADAELRWKRMKPTYVPEDEIPPGDETNRLQKWGYRYYHEMFNSRQLLGLESSCRLIAEVPNTTIRNALATNLSDLLRYQNMLCRYDTMALKSLDIFSVHGFPVGLIQCESNILGISNGDGTFVGSGGWVNIIGKYYKAKSFCNSPFEVRHVGKRKIKVPITGEWIGEQRDGALNPKKRQIHIFCESSMGISLEPQSLDAVFTDPPYFGNVQYAELMDFCYVWLRRLVGKYDRVFENTSTRNRDELTGNVSMARDLDHFTKGLSIVFKKMAYALKPGSPFAFTYHHNDLEAYLPIAIAVLDAGLTCSASLPCPAEMGASIHISGTKSSIVDTIFVCRSTGSVPKKWITESSRGVAELVRDDIIQLEQGGLVATPGDIRCIIYGHLIRLAVWFLRMNWKVEQSVSKKMASISDYLSSFGRPESVASFLDEYTTPKNFSMFAGVKERRPVYEDEISF